MQLVTECTVSMLSMVLKLHTMMSELSMVLKMSPLQLCQSLKNLSIPLCHYTDIIYQNDQDTSLVAAL